MGPRQLKGLSQIFAHIPEKNRPDLGLELISNAKRNSNFIEVNVDKGTYVVTLVEPVVGPDGKPLKGKVQTKVLRPAKEVKEASGSRTIKK